MCRILRAQWQDVSILVAKAPDYVRPIISYVSCKILQSRSRKDVSQRHMSLT